jgi:predicted MFS family arabinose efflux permease
MSAEPSARQEWTKGWPLLLACGVGVSAPSAMTFAIGQFMAPLEHTFGWTRTEVTAGMSLSLIASIVLSPIIGRIADLTNARVLVLIGCVLTAADVAALSLVGDLKTWIALWMIHTLCSGWVSPVIWLTVIPGAFRKNRSLAMALTLAGTSLSATFAPPLAHYLLDHMDWRQAVQVFALIWYGGTGALAAFFFFDHRPRLPRATAAAKIAAKAKVKTGEAGPSIWAVFRSANFVRLAIVVLAVKTALQAYMIHLSPALVDHGFNGADAAKIAAVAGVSAFVGKLCVGWLFDRSTITAVSTAVMTSLAVSCLLFALMNGQLLWALAACITLGLAHGAMLTVVACITAKLFQPREFGVVFGGMTSAMALATALGPTLASMSHDRFGTYGPVYWGGIVIAAGSLLLLTTLKPAAPTLAVAAAPAE